MGDLYGFLYSGSSVLLFSCEHGSYQAIGSILSKSAELAADKTHVLSCVSVYPDNASICSSELWLLSPNAGSPSPDLCAGEASSSQPPPFGGPLGYRGASAVGEWEELMRDSEGDVDLSPGRFCLVSLDYLIFCPDGVVIGLGQGSFRQCQYPCTQLCRRDYGFVLWEISMEKWMSWMDGSP